MSLSAVTSVVTVYCRPLRYRSPKDSCLFLVREHDPQALSKSFDELKLFDEEQADDMLTVSVHTPASRWSHFECLLSRGDYFSEISQKCVSKLVMSWQMCC